MRRSPIEKRGSLIERSNRPPSDVHAGLVCHTLTFSLPLLDRLRLRLLALGHVPIIDWGIEAARIARAPRSDSTNPTLRRCSAVSTTLRRSPTAFATPVPRGSGRRSTTTTERRCCPSSAAAKRPAIPPPTTTTSAVSCCCFNRGCVVDMDRPLRARRTPVLASLWQLPHKALVAHIVHATQSW